MTTPSLASSSSSSELHEIAKRGCKSRCGDVEIPYPFGIRAGCYLDKWFEILCLKSTPLLRHDPELEVLQINVEMESTIKVRHPITFSKCREKKLYEAANLTGSPFVFSQKKNRFTAVSCDQLALMKSTNDYYADTVGACMSICDKTTTEKSCNGMNCCQTTIPLNLRSFHTEFGDQISIYWRNNSRRQRGECVYAFLVDLEWFQVNHSGGYKGIKEMGKVPVALEWSLYNWTMEDLGISFALNSTSSFHCENDRNASSFKCYCNRGFEGNPYIVDGCQEKNECKSDGNNPCGDGICMNLSGSYQCLWPDDPRKRTAGKRVILGLSVGFSLLFLLISSWCLHKIIKKRRRTRRKEKFFKRNGGLLLQQEMSSSKVNVEKTKLFTAKELKKATDNFNADRILGQGGQGTVYKGMLADGRIVAVKKSKILDEGKIAEFINEVVILSQINHRNVVKLLGCCLETEVPLLVYEFIQNGTLSEYIHNKNEEFPFTWEIRLRVATEIAGALFYLHSAASRPIYHRDIKSTNVLLDDKYKAKIADFGTSRTLNVDQTHLTTQVHGTFGYLDPEYFQSNQFTEKSDVYSFGVLLVELLTGQKAISMNRSPEGRSLAIYFILSMKENRLFDILDAKVMEGPKEEVLVVANIANRCLSLSGRKRPTMKEVTVELEGIKISEKASNFQPQYEEIEYARKGKLIDPNWDVISTSFGSALDSTSGDRSSSLHELPLLSFTAQN
ncbi:Wall-associated receptor kinase-like 9 [Morus notabilis]|uniref:Wall-associated receptor kinase-like 9 n=2 Tax=Morus notabilis TaxID=981085 RepID=W9QN93_9ROSA|nr:Wall-associated receptor kinase-like 9 [Morus notabilis]